jgi:hypothetical protein
MNMVRRLITIFNANDPTPTASALRNCTFDEAIVLVIGSSNYSFQVRENLSRLKTWASGSARKHDESVIAWPDELWNVKWDWPAIRGDRIEYVEVEDVIDLRFDFIDNDEIDLTSGSKAHAIALAEHAIHSKANVSFSIQTQSGDTLCLQTGILSNHDTPLTARECVFLSSGYILDATNRGDPEIGRKIIEANKIEVKSHNLSYNISELDAIGVNENKSKIVFNPNDPLINDFKSAIGLDYSTTDGFWMEKAAGHLIRTWPDVQEVFIGPRLIPTSLNSVLTIAYLTLGLSKNKKTKFLGRRVRSEADVRRLAELRLDYFMNPEKLDLRKKLANSMHAVEFDILAISSASVIVGECKHTNCVDLNMIARLSATAKSLFPTRSVPLMIYSGTSLSSISGVYLISWPSLEASNIIENIWSGNVQEKRYEITSQKKTNTEDKEKISGSKKSVNRPVSAQENEILEMLLRHMKIEPLPYQPTFQAIMKNLKIPTKGLMQHIKTTFSEKLGFTLNPSNQQTKLWIVWDEEE